MDIAGTLRNIYLATAPVLRLISSSYFMERCSKDRVKAVKTKQISHLPSPSNTRRPSDLYDCV